MVLHLFVTTSMQIILSNKPKICVALEGRYVGLTSGFGNSTRFTFLSYIKGRIHGLSFVVILELSNFLNASSLLLNHKTVIRETCLVKLISVLKVLDLSCKVNFTLEKLLGHDLLLILFAFTRICVFLHFALVSTVNVL